jgi:ribosomal protein S27AE
MNATVAWLLGESCPGCGTGLTLVDDGTAPARAECGSCGFTEVRAVTVPAGRGDR